MRKVLQMCRTMSVPWMIIGTTLFSMAVKNIVRLNEMQFKNSAGIAALMYSWQYIASSLS